MNNCIDAILKIALVYAKVERPGNPLSKLIWLHYGYFYLKPQLKVLFQDRTLKQHVSSFKHSHQTYLNGGLRYQFRKKSKSVSQSSIYYSAVMFVAF